MDDFNKVGRLQRPQFLPSTRGFGLDGKEIIFKTPIKPKPYRKRRKRAKHGIETKIFMVVKGERGYLEIVKMLVLMKMKGDYQDPT